MPPVPAVAIVRDSDNDGVPDSLDQCPATARGAAVNSEGCALFVGVIKGVNFFSNSDKLTNGSKTILDDVAATLGNYPTVKLDVNAQTDSHGAADYNLSLSRKRAISVSAYLVSRGVAKGRLTTSAYGETQPIATNDTPVAKPPSGVVRN